MQQTCSFERFFIILMFSKLCCIIFGLDDRFLRRGWLGPVSLEKSHVTIDFSLSSSTEVGWNSQLKARSRFPNVFARCERVKDRIELLEIS